MNSHVVNQTQLNNYYFSYFRSCL